MSDNRQNKAVENKEDNNNVQQVQIMNEQQQNQLENGMKDLLEKILTYMEKFIKTKEDLQAIEGKLSDYDNLHSLLEIIKSIFAHLTLKVDEQFEKQAKQQKLSQSSPPSEGNADYDQLEKILQKHEADIRFHIRSNQTMKLYQENLQQKLDESEQSRSELLESTKLMISDIKRQNNQLGEQISKLEAENKVLQERVKTSGENEKIFEEKIKNLPFLQEKIQTLERIIKDNNNKSSSHDKYLSGITQLQQQQLQTQYQQNIQQQPSNLSSSTLQKDNSLKKMSSAIIVNSTSSADYELFQKPLKKQQVFHENTSNLKNQNNYNNPSGISSLLSTHSTSPLKVAERRTHTPTLTTQQNKLKENALKSSYQRFYNNIKGTNNKEESSSIESLMTAAALLPRKSLPNGVIINGSNYTVSGSGNALEGRGSAGLGSSLSNNYNLHNGSSVHVHLHTNSSGNNNSNNYMNKELKTAPSLPINHNSSSKNGVMMGQLVASTLREKDSKMQTASGGNSMTNSQNNSFIGNNNSSNLNSNSIKNFKPTSSHKRSKSHQVNNKIRGIVGNNIHNNNGSSNLAVKNITDYSRMSSQDISEIQLTSVGNYK